MSISSLLEKMNFYPDCYEIQDCEALKICGTINASRVKNLDSNETTSILYAWRLLLKNTSQGDLCNFQLSLPLNLAYISPTQPSFIELLALASATPEATLELKANVNGAALSSTYDGYSQTNLFETPVTLGTGTHVVSVFLEVPQSVMVALGLDCSGLALLPSIVTASFKELKSACMQTESAIVGCSPTVRIAKEPILQSQFLINGVTLNLDLPASFPFYAIDENQELVLIQDQAEAIAYMQALNPGNTYVGAGLFDVIPARVPNVVPTAVNVSVLLDLDSLAPLFPYAYPLGVQVYNSYGAPIEFRFAGNNAQLLEALQASYPDVLHSADYSTFYFPPASALFGQDVLGSPLSPMELVFAVSPSELTVVLPIYGIEYVTVDWGDGSPLELVTSGDEIPHTYAVAGNYNVVVLGITDSVDFGHDFIGQFLPASPAVITNPTTLALVQVVSYGNMLRSKLSFSGAYNVTSFPAAGAPPESTVTDMEGFFQFATVDADVSDFNMENVISGRAMFRGALVAQPDTTGWTVNNLVNADYMFAGLFGMPGISNPDVASWNMSNVTTIQGMFAFNTLANPNVASWDTSEVTDMGGVFYNNPVATPVTTGWQTGNVLNMRSMFDGASSANPDVSTWNLSKVTTIAFMFFNAVSAIPVTTNWQVGNVVDMSSVFNGAILANPDVSNWDVRKVQLMAGMFANTQQANPNISLWQTLSLTKTNSMFQSTLVAAPDTTNLNMSKVTDMSFMFLASSVANPVTDNWDTGQVQNMSYVFANQSASNPNVTNWDVKNVTNVDSMFSNNAVATPDVSLWNTQSMTNMFRFVGNTVSAVNLDFTNWDFRNVTNIALFKSNGVVSQQMYSSFIYAAGIGPKRMAASGVELFYAPILNWVFSGSAALTPTPLEITGKDYINGNDTNHTAIQDTVTPVFM